MSFLTDVEAQAKAETERVIKELTQLKFDAQQVIHVLNALKLEVPKELRELSPIERVPLPMVAVPKELHPIPSSSGKSVDVQVQQRETRNKGSLAGVKTRQAKAAKREQEIRKAITDQLSKGPVLRAKLMEALPYPEYPVNKIAARMKKEGLLGYRVVGYQGPTEWFLTSRPVCLEKLRDEVVGKEGLIPLSPLLRKFGFKNTKDLESMLDELVTNGILIGELGTYRWEKPKGTSIKTAAEHQRTNNFSGGVKRGSPIKGTGRRAKLSASKEVQQILAKAESHGAQTKKQGNDHIRVELGDKFVTLSSSPGDNNRANREKLKDLGINV